MKPSKQIARISGAMLATTIVLFTSVATAATVNLVAGTTYNPSSFTATDDVVLDVTGVSFNPGTYTFNSLTVKTTRTLTIKGDTTNNSGVIINAATVSVVGTGSITASAQGFSNTAGPGAPATANGIGASHGGRGGKDDNSGTAKDAYGDAFAPTMLGSGNIGTTGGGAIKIVATTSVSIAGSIKADAGSSGGWGGSSGGSIWIDSPSITGSGSITANGGAGSSDGGGSGGRIYIKYSGTAFPGTVTVTGGTTSLGAAYYGSGGTIVLNDSVNTPVCTGGGTVNTTASYYSGDVTITGNCTWIVDGDVSVNSLSLNQTGLIFSVIGNLTSATSINLVSGAQLVMYGDLDTGIGYTITANSVSIASGASINANGMGFGSGAGPQPGQNGSYGAGGGYGGAGANTTNATGGSAYGSPINPNRLGSGGGVWGANTGGTGGGAIKLIVATNLVNAGTIAANGTTAPMTDSGGGSGGSVWIEVSGTLSGAGTITAAGGNGYNASSGGGGGGRVYIKYGTNTLSGSVTAAKGSNGTGGSAGSVLMVNMSTGAWNCTSTLAVDGVDLSGALAINGGCKLTVTGAASLTTVSVTGSGTILYMNGNLNVFGGIDVTTSGEVVMGSDTVTGFGYTVSAAYLNVASTAKFDSDGKGYPATQGPNAGNAGVSGSYGSGAGHGGVGGAGSSAGGTTYGSSASPIYLGAGGGTGSTGTGGNGGGAIKIIVPGTVTVGGTISVNGSNGGTSRGGGGAGGSLWIIANTVTGAGSITANGGNSGGGIAGGGGGGRVYIALSTKSFTGTETSKKGTGSSPGDGTFLWSIVGSAVKVAFSNDPSSLARKNALFGSQPIVIAQDSSGNMISTFTGTVTLNAYSDASCTTPATGVLSGSNSNINGFVWFSGVMYDTSETIYLQASSSGLTSTDCEKVVVGGNRATQLVFTTQASASSVAGVTFAQQPEIKALDADGNVDVLAEIVTLLPYTVSNCTNSVAIGLTSSPSMATPGVTNFASMQATKAGSYYLGASLDLDGGVTLTSCGTVFAIVAGPTSKLLFDSGQATTGTAGVALTPQFSISGADQYNNLTTDLSASTTLSVFTGASCTGAGTGTPAGLGPYTPSAGVVTTSGVSYTKAENIYFKATAGALTGCSARVTISAGPAATLTYTTQPSSTGVTNVNLRVSPVVGALDTYGNTATFTALSTFDPFTDNTCTTPAAGTATATRVGATNTYKLRYSDVGTVYFKVSSGALTPACSNAVALIKNPPIFFRGF